MKNIFRFGRCNGFRFVVFCLSIITNPLNAQWIQTNGPRTELTNTLAVGVTSAGDTILFAGTYHGGVFLSTNYGDSWEQIDGGDIMMGDTGFTQKDIRALVAIRNGTGGISLFAGTSGDGIFISQNADTIWTPSNTGLTNKTVYALVVSYDAKGDTNIYAGTGGGIFLSTNKGSNWIATSTELRGYFAFIISRNAAGDTIFFKLDVSRGVLRSLDNGAQWNAVNSGLPSNKQVTCLAAYDTIVYAGTSGYGVYYSLDGGLNWVTGGGSPSTIKILLVGGSYLFAGVGTPFSVMGSVWRRPLSEMLTSVEDNYEQTPSIFALEQNYPNPFNPSTDISFSLPSKEYITLKVYNLLGQEISTLFSGMVCAGNHILRLDASSFGSGIYFYRLQTERFSKTKKLVILR